MNPILKVENLTKTFSPAGQEAFTAVNGVSFELYPGETLAIIGESGSGKTTTVNMVARLLDTTSGSVFLDGENITHLKGEALHSVYRKMQMVFQSPADSFDPRRTLGDGISEPLRNAGIPRKEARIQAEMLLGKCELSKEYYSRYPHQVSGGQCQRAAIARALVIKPSVLICDEATAALDVTTQKEILELLTELKIQQGKNLSILFICHDISLVQQFCDRVIVMQHGKIVEEGTPNEVIWNPKSSYTKQLIESVL